MFVKASISICIVTDADNPNKKEDLKMQWSDHVGLLYDKMVQVNEKTSQPKTKENKKCVLSHLIIWAKNELS